MNIIDHYEKWTVIWGCSKSRYNLLPLKHSPWYLMCDIENIPKQNKKITICNLLAREMEVQFYVHVFCHSEGDRCLWVPQTLWPRLAQWSRDLSLNREEVKLQASSEVGDKIHSGSRTRTLTISIYFLYIWHSDIWSLPALKKLPFPGLANS